MQITSIIATHGNKNITFDTIESVKHYMTDQILLVVDAVGWDEFDTKNPCVPMLKGFYHNYHRAPYRNVILSLLAAGQSYPNSDWYCYLEYDALVGSSVFKKDLEIAKQSNVWMIGNDFRDKQDIKMPLVENILKTKFEEKVYLLGAILFYNGDFIRKCKKEKFFEKFLFYTNEFKNGFFPEYTAWDLTEHMMPTLAQHWGGKVEQFAKWIPNAESWIGNHRRYPIRWQPDLPFEEQNYLQASLMHPLKTYDHPIRQFHRSKRNKHE